MVPTVTLNLINHAYGPKPSHAIPAWEEALRLLATRSAEYAACNYHGTLASSYLWLKSQRITHLNALPGLTEIELATLYFTGMAHLKSGWELAAVAPLSLAHSQQVFACQMLDGFAHYPAAAEDALYEIAARLGPHSIANPNWDGFFERIRATHPPRTSFATVALALFQSLQRRS